MVERYWDPITKEFAEPARNDPTAVKPMKGIGL